MDTQKIARGGLATLSLIGLLVPSKPGSAQVTLNALPSVAAQSPATFSVLSSAAVQNAVKVDSNGLFWDGTRVPEVRVNSPRELINTLTSDFKGRLIVPHDVQWDLSGFENIPVHSGVGLIGERGELGSRPTIFTDDKGTEYTLFEITGNDVRVEGLHFRGPANGSRSSAQPYVHAIRLWEDPVQKLGRRIVIADNEFNEWTGAGVEVRGTLNVRLPSEYQDGWPHILPEEAGLVSIERNYLHHNARDNGGYGVTVTGGAYATIFGNVFDFNRHAVASSGFAYGGYVARFNYVLQGGFKQDSYYNQHFDVHGTNDTNGDGKSTGYGGTAGEYYEIAYNTIRGEQDYYLVKTRPSLMLRGAPTIGAYFHDNVDVHDDLDAAVSLKWEKGDSGIGEDEPKFHFHASNNAFDRDYSTELATGDFDGDGRTDVFTANGTAWFFSRGGSQPWAFLHASTKRIGDLAFADIDNDGRTDVLYRDAAGNLGYLKSGVYDLVPLTTSPVAVKDLRFGDFDGDGKTDIFYTLGGQWWIWYGRTRAWTPAASSSLPLSELLFGEFDTVRGTDVAGVTSGMWAYSSAALGSWTRLNSQLTSSFANCVAADFDGNGRSDIAYSDGQKWYYSRDGRSALVVLRSGDSRLLYPSLKGLLLGRFDKDARTKAVTFNLEVISSLFGSLQFKPGLLLVMWDGLGSDSAFNVRSVQNMR